MNTSNNWAGTSNSLTNLYEYVERRTSARIADGTYRPVPDDFPTKHGTGVHISTNNPELLAYYPTLEHIKRDRPQQIKPGRYLKKYFPEMSDDDIRIQASRVKPMRLEFFSNWEDMFEVYRELDRNDVVESCMSKDNWGSKHPLMVYHNSDVELAVLYDGDMPVARALYNKNTREYPMVYGQWERMKNALDNAGFVHGSLNGARINRIDRHGRGMENNGSDELLMPYIDGHRPLDRSEHNPTNVDVFDNWVTINEHGEFKANEWRTMTLAISNTRCECCGDGMCSEEGVWIEQEEITVCESCYNYNCVTVYGERRGHEFVATQEYAERNYVYIDAANQWFEDDSAALANGWIYSRWHEDYLRNDDVVYVEGMDDYVHYDQCGYVFVYIDGDAVDIDDVDPSKTYWDGSELTDSGEDELRLDNIRRNKYTDRPTNFPKKLWDSLPINDHNADIFEVA
jgi:hypothetical protein